MIVLERGDASDARLQMASRGAVAGANLQEMIAQGGAIEDPRKQLASGKLAPERRGADEVFGCVHRKGISVAQWQSCKTRGSKRNSFRKDAERGGGPYYADFDGCW